MWRRVLQWAGRAALRQSAPSTDAINTGLGPRILAHFHSPPAMNDATASCPCCLRRPSEIFPEGYIPGLIAYRELKGWDVAQPSGGEARDPA
jgi:hypothetical protein